MIPKLWPLFVFIVACSSFEKSSDKSEKPSGAPMSAEQMAKLEPAPTPRAQLSPIPEPSSSTKSVKTSTTVVTPAPKSQPSPVALDDQDWEKIGEDDGITTWRKEIPGNPVVAFKGRGMIDAPITKVASALDDPNRQKEWMSDMAEVYNVEVISETERVEYDHASVPWPFHDRDFVVRSKVEVIPAKEPTFMIRSWSVEHPKVPVKDGLVRGEIYDTYFKLVSKEGNTKTELTLEIFADPKGAIPKWLVNLFQKAWPRETMEGLQKQVKKPDLLPHPKIVEWLKTWRPSAP